jgi:fructokinase
VNIARDLDVLCLGELLVDLLPDRRGPLEACERFEPCPGGAPANVATGLARLGRRVAFQGVVGEDPFGRLLARRVGAEGVECRLRRTAERPTGLWFVALDARGDRSFFSPNARFSADKLLAPADVDPALLARAAWLHVGSSAHVLPEAQEALRTAVAAARSAGTRISFDPNVRPHLWDDLGACVRLCRDVFPACDLVKVAEEEAALLTGEPSPEGAAAWLSGRGVALACVTLGDRGALVRRGEDVLHVPAEPVEVVDATGAGDGFVAGLLAALCELGPPEALDRGGLARAVRFANGVAGRVCGRVGAVAGLPRAGELSL